MLIRDSRVDSSGSAVPIAFVLLLGLGVLTFHLYSVAVVPQLIFDEEVAAHRATITDVQEFDYAVRYAVATGEPQPVVFGDRIDHSVLHLPPSDPRYAARTTEPSTVTFEDYERLCDEAEMVSPQTSETGPAAPPCENEPFQHSYNVTNVIFLADYAYHSQPLIYGYEYGLVYSSPDTAVEGDDSIITHSEQPIVDHDRISLYLFNDEFIQAGEERVALTVFPTATRATEFTVTGDDRPMKLTMATEIGEAEWNRILREEMSENGGHVQKIDYRNYTVEIEEGKQPGTAQQEHWYDCEHSGQGEPFVKCVEDDAKNYVTLFLDPDVEYSVAVYESSFTS